MLERMFEVSGGAVRTEDSPWLPTAGRADVARCGAGAAPVGRRRARLLLEQVGVLGERIAALRAAQLRTVAELVGELEGLPALVVAEHGPGGGPAGADGPVGDAEDAAAAEIAVRLHLSGMAAQRLVEEALALCTRLPGTLAALEAGVIDDVRARVISEQTAVLGPVQAARVEAVLGPEMGGLTAGELRARVRHVVGAVDAAAVRVRARRGVCDRQVRLVPLEDGLAQLSAVGPALDLAVVFDRLTGLGRDRSRPGGRTDPHAAFVHGVDPKPDEPGGGLPDRRGMGARRFDALVDLASGRVGTGDEVGSAVGRSGGARSGGARSGGAESGAGAGGRWSRSSGPQVLVALTSVLGLDAEPAQVAGVGPVPVELVRQVLVDHPFRRVWTEPPTGQLLGVDGHLLPPGLLPPCEGRAPGPTGGGGPPARPSTGDPSRGSRADGPAPRAERSTRTPSAVGRPDPGGAVSDGCSPGGVAVPPAGAPDPGGRVPGGRGPGGQTPGGRRTCPVAAAGGGAYVPGAGAARLVRARSPRCTAPGCRVPATRCDLDHRTPWPQGPTCPCNLVPLCRRHHLAKHRFGWRVELTDEEPRDTTARWTSPLRQTVTVPAQPFLPAPVRVTSAEAAAGVALHPVARVMETYPPDDPAAHDLRRVRALVAEDLETGALGRGGRRPGAPVSREDDPPPF